MEELFLKAENREGRGKGFARRLRRKGFIPAIMYGEGELLPLALDAKELRQALRTEAGENALMKLKVAGEESKDRTVMVRELQVDPIRGDLIHADLVRISMEKEVEVEVPIELTGKPKVLVLVAGALLSQLVNALKVRCLPVHIPKSVTVDVENLEIGEALHVSDIATPAEVTVLNEPSEAVASISVVAEEVVAAPVEGVAEGEAAAAAEGAPEGEEGKPPPEGGAGQSGGKEAKGGKEKGD